MFTTVAQILTAVHTCNLACADPLINHDRRTKRGHPGLIYGVFFGRHIKYLCVLSLQVTGTYSPNTHRGAIDTHAQNDRLTSALTYFSKSQRSKCKNQILAQPG